VLYFVCLTLITVVSVRATLSTPAPSPTTSLTAGFRALSLLGILVLGCLHLSLHLSLHHDEDLLLWSEHHQLLVLLELERVQLRELRIGNWVLLPSVYLGKHAGIRDCNPTSLDWVKDCSSVLLRVESELVTDCCLAIDWSSHLWLSKSLLGLLR